MTKRCPRCKRTLGQNLFTVDRRSPSGLAAYCKDCVKEYRDAYRARKTDTYLISRKKSAKKIQEKRRAMPEPKTKQCSSCKLILPGSDFHTVVSYSDGKDAYCKACRLSSNRKNVYGLDSGALETMLDAQNNRCAICFIEFDGIKFHIDHDHASGKVRGLLCRGCNWGLGNFKDSIEALTNAIDYLNIS